MANLDYWGSDFSGNAGILGTSGTYYPSSLGANAFFNKQFHSLYAWRSIGNANYHALQASLRKRMSQGVQFDFNYTYSKSIDISSDAERIDAYSGLGGQVINSWDPNALRAVSDFDTTHQFNANWVVELPFGRGKGTCFRSSRNRAGDCWRLAAIRSGPLDQRIPDFDCQRRHLAYQLAVGRSGRCRLAPSMPKPPFAPMAR